VTEDQGRVEIDSHPRAGRAKPGLGQNWANATSAKTTSATGMEQEILTGCLDKCSEVLEALGECSASHCQRRSVTATSSRLVLSFSTSFSFPVPQPIALTCLPSCTDSHTFKMSTIPQSQAAAVYDHPPPYPSPYLVTHQQNRTLEKLESQDLVILVTLGQVPVSHSIT
jgi:hypothetical protein